MLLVPTLIDSVTVRKKKISDQEMQSTLQKLNFMHKTTYLSKCGYNIVI